MTIHAVGVDSILRGLPAVCDVKINYDRPIISKYGNCTPPLPDAGLRTHRELRADGSGAGARDSKHMLVEFLHFVVCGARDPGQRVTCGLEP